MAQRISLTYCPFFVHCVPALILLMVQCICILCFFLTFSYIITLLAIFLPFNLFGYKIYLELKVRTVKKNFKHIFIYLYFFLLAPYTIYLLLYMKYNSKYIVRESISIVKNFEKNSPESFYTFSFGFTNKRFKTFRYNIFQSKDLRQKICNILININLKSRYLLLIFSSALAGVRGIK